MTTRNSLASRLTLWYALFAFLLMVATTAYLYWALHESLDQENDGALLDQVHILRLLLRDHPTDSPQIRQEVELESGARQQNRMYIRITDAQGRMVAETPGMAERLPAGIFPAPADGASGEDRHGGGSTYRLRTDWAAVGDQERALIIQAAMDRREQHQLLAQFRSRLLPLLGVGVLICVGVGYQIARRGLMPIVRISETAARIRSNTLHERLPAGEFPAELAALAATFNGMLDRLQESFERLSRFSADIAHELRTPLNNLRGEGEIALGKPRTPEEYRETLSSLLEEAGRLSRLIESLLFLARAEHPETQIRRESLQLGEVLEGVRDFYEAAATDSGVSLRVDLSAPIEAALDRTLLQRAVGNLVENSLAHTASGGSITLSAERENGSLRIEVADTGCGIAAEHLPRVFDRLYRVDASRSAATGGAGLGLAIVKSIADLHGGRSEISSEPGKGTRVTLVLPREMTKT